MAGTKVEFVTLSNGDASMLFEVPTDGVPIWRHLGRSLGQARLPAFAEITGRSAFAMDRAVPLSIAPLAGRGWFGPELVQLRGADGKRLQLDLESIRVDARTDGMGVMLADRTSGIGVEISIRVDPGGAYRMTSLVHNGGAEPVTVDRLCSAVIPLSAGMAEIVSWRGGYADEFVEAREAMPAHGWTRETRQGLTGHGGPPGCYILEAGADWHCGLVVAVQVAWSGNARVLIERSEAGGWLLAAEPVFLAGEQVIEPGGVVTAPELIVAVSTDGRNGAMAQQHAAVRSAVGWPGGNMTPRPVHLNSWEACYFDHDAATIDALATAAANLGAERFVLDDGWFRGRDHDRAGLGDWESDPLKYPGGIGAVARRVEALGMQFGLWVEPEMVNPDSDLYRAHPDWVLALPGRDRPESRHQLVLNLRRDDVREHLVRTLDRLLGDAPIRYLKWDHNRPHAPGGGAAQTHGLYLLLDRLRAAHPHVEIESCAAGGGRCDAGIATFVHRFWASDNIDAVSRIEIQRGFLAFLPPEMMGAHVGASPAHLTGRSQSLAFRAAMALPGHFGIELDARKLDAGQAAELRQWVAFYKQWRDLLHGGATLLGEGGDGLLWQAAGNGDRWLLFVIRRDPSRDRRPAPLRLPFLAGGSWRARILAQAGERARHADAEPPLFGDMRADGAIFAGDLLAQAGLPLPRMLAETVLIISFEPALP